MSDRWSDRLSEYLDGELSAGERQELEAHVAGCEECAKTLEQLRQVIERAKRLEDTPPVTDLWSGIAERISEPPEAEQVAELEAHRRGRVARLSRRRLTLSLPQLAAASIALMVLSAGTAWMVSRSGDVGERVSSEPAVEATRAAGFTASSYDAAIAELERIIDESRDRLDTATVRVIAENLLIIDRAIVQAQRALAQDPGSEYLNEYLTATKRQKLEFLMRAAEMTGAVS
jgi:anti-sigma factor RsiW